MPGMKERIITGWCALGALLLFLTMFIHIGGSSAGPAQVPHPTTQESSGNGYRAAMQWLRAEHIPVLSWRDRFDRLAQHRELANRGNLLIVTLPTSTAIRSEEFRALERWIASGNTLLIMAALADDPIWAHPLAGLAAADLNLLSGLTFESLRSRERRPRERSQSVRSGAAAARARPARRAFAAPERATLVANRPHFFFEGVAAGIALSDYPAQTWRVKVPYDGFVLVLGHQRESGAAALFIRARGAGHVVISTFGSPFTNRAIGLGDNARLLANIVAATVAPDGSVLFDDLHQGLSAAYDPARFYRDSRLYWTIAILCVVWLSWVLGSTRLRAPLRAAPAPRPSELVQVTGRFLARVLRSDAGADMLFQHFLRRGPWKVLECHPRLAPQDLQCLRSWQADALAGRRVPLVRLHELLVRIDRELGS